MDGGRHGHGHNHSSRLSSSPSILSSSSSLFSSLVNDSLLPPPSPHLHHLRRLSRPDPPPPHPPHRRRHPTASPYRPRPPLPEYAAPMNCSSLHKPPTPPDPLHGPTPTQYPNPFALCRAGEESQKEEEEEEEAHRRRDARDSPATSFWLGVVCVCVREGWRLKKQHGWLDL